MSIRKGSGEILPSVARTATVPDIAIDANTTDISLEAAINCHIIIDMTAITATGSVTPKLFYEDPVSGTEIDLIDAIAAITTVSVVVLKLGKDIVAAAGLAAQDFIPDNMKIRFTHLNAVAMTYSVGIVAEFDSYK